MLFKQVVNDGSSFYAVTYAGALLWYRDNRRDGTNAPDGSTGWDPNSGSQIGIGWDQFSSIFASHDVIIYAIKPTGELLWFRDILRNGTNPPDGTAGWDSNSGKV